MSQPFVADSSIGLAWVHPSQATDFTARLLADVEAGAAVHVTNLWPLEVGNALLVAVRRKLMTDRQRQTALGFLAKLNLLVDPETALHAWSETSDLASRYGLSVYDASYLELSRRKQLPLASRDEPLCAAARRAGVKVLG